MGQTDKLAHDYDDFHFIFILACPFLGFAALVVRLSLFLFQSDTEKKSSVEAAAELLNRTGVAVRYDPDL